MSLAGKESRRTENKYWKVYKYETNVLKVKAHEGGKGRGRCDQHTATATSATTRRKERIKRTNIRRNVAFPAAAHIALGCLHKYLTVDARNVIVCVWMWFFHYVPQLFLVFFVWFVLNKPVQPNNNSKLNMLYLADLEVIGIYYGKKSNVDFEFFFKNITN